MFANEGAAIPVDPSSQCLQDPLVKKFNIMHAFGLFACLLMAVVSMGKNTVTIQFIEASRSEAKPSEARRLGLGDERPSFISKYSPPILSNVVISVDYNTYYLKYWKLMKEGWEGLLGVKLFLFLIVKEGQEVDLSEFSPLGDDYLRVVRVPKGASTMQASQWARVLGAGLVKARSGGMNIISDMDLLPASAKYFNAPLHRLRNETKEILMYYRHSRLDHIEELAMGYIAGHPGAWQKLTEVHNWNDFTQAMNNLPGNYSNRHGGKGWSQDQAFVWKWAHDPARNNGTILAGFKDQDLGFKRKDVLISQKEVPTLLHHIRRCEFTDIHMKAHDVGLPGPYWDVMINVSKSCNIQSGDFMDSLVKADKLPVYGMSSIMRKPNLKE
jgi:hypothetical protein